MLFIFFNILFRYLNCPLMLFSLHLFIRRHSRSYFLNVPHPDHTHFRPRAIVCGCVVFTHSSQDHRAYDIPLAITKAQWAALFPAYAKKCYCWCAWGPGVVGPALWRFVVVQFWPHEKSQFCYQTKWLWHSPCLFISISLEFFFMLYWARLQTWCGWVGLLASVSDLLPLREDIFLVFFFSSLLLVSLLLCLKESFYVNLYHLHTE